MYDGGLSELKERKMKKKKKKSPLFAGTWEVAVEGSGR